MQISSHQMEELIRRVGAVAIRGWADLPQSEQHLIGQDIFSKILPILQELPRDTTPESLLERKEYFRAHALKRIMSLLKSTGRFPGQSELQLLNRIGEGDLEKYAMHLMALTHAALSFLPEEETLVDLLAQAPTWDWDGELETLIKESDEGTATDPLQE